MGSASAEKGADSDDQDRVFLGRIRKHSTNGLVCLQERGHGDVWYRPATAVVARDIARYADNDRIVVRVRADVILKASAPLTDEDDTQAIQDAHVEERRADQAVKGQKAKSPDQENALARLRDTSRHYSHVNFDSLEARKCDRCRRTMAKESDLIGGRCVSCR